MSRIALKSPALLKFIQATYRLTEVELENLINLIQSGDFKPKELPTNLYQYKRVRDYLLQTFKQDFFEYSFEGDGGNVPLHYCRNNLTLL